MTQKVFVIEEQFLKAGPGHAGELEFRFLRRAAGLAAFGYVLHSAARRLDHLVPGTAAKRHIAIAKTHRQIVTKSRQLKCF